MGKETKLVRKELLEETTRYNNQGLAHMADCDFSAAKKAFEKVKIGLSYLKMEMENNG